MDEPTADSTNQVLKFVKPSRAEETILLSTHILQEVPEVADRIILINNGGLF